MSLPLDIFSPAQAAILVGFAAVLGACLGSFVNCLAWRKAHGESVLAGRSRCPSCGHVLGQLDLVPVVSWIVLRGRCRHCGTRVSVRYVLVEVLLAAVFVALLVVYGASPAWLAYAALVCVLLAAALVDFDTFTIPNGFVIAAIGTWVLMMAASAAGLVVWPLANSAASAVAQAQVAAMPLARRRGREAAVRRRAVLGCGGLALEPARRMHRRFGVRPRPGAFPSAVADFRCAGGTD